MEPIQIKDIKPMIAIDDNGVYLLAVLILIAIIAIIAIVYLLIHWYKHKKRINVRQINYQLLEQIDFHDSKKAAYDITKYGYIFKDDTQRNSEMYANLVGRLQSYKYKAQVDTIDEETRSYFELYKGMIDV
jgi:hypothetical protein